MTTIDETKAAKLYKTKSWGYHVVDKINLTVDGRKTEQSFGQDLKKAEARFNELNKQ